MTDARTCVRWLERDQPSVEEATAAAIRIVNDGSRATEIIERLRSLYKKDLPQRELVEVNEIIRIEDLLDFFPGEPHTRIADRDQQLTILAQLRLDRKDPTCFLHLGKQSSNSLILNELHYNCRRQSFDLQS